MVSAAGLFYENENSLDKTLELMASEKDDTPLVIQLFGNNPEHFAKATKIIDSLPQKPTKNFACKNREFLLRKPEGIDINFGCPVKKVMKQESGCALMRKPKLAKKIIEAVLRSTGLPVSVKIRTGIEEKTAFDFLDEVADLNWQTIIVHGRTFSEGFSGEINFDMIKKIKEKYPEKTVIANGGIFSPEKAKTTLKKTGADGIAIARGALGKPWIFSQIRSFLETGKYKNPEISEIKKTAIEHAELMKERKGEKAAFEMRKHLGWYFKGFPEARKLRRKLMKVETVEDIKEILK